MSQKLSPLQKLVPLLRSSPENRFEVRTTPGAQYVVKFCYNSTIIGLDGIIPRLKGGVI